ncbi:hypothetical protein D3C84_631540 [compost metagenome]
MSRFREFANLVEKTDRTDLVLDAVPHLLFGHPFRPGHAGFPVQTVAHAARWIGSIGVHADGRDVLPERLQIEGRQKIRFPAQHRARQQFRLNGASRDHGHVGDFVALHVQVKMPEPRLRE